MTNRPLIVDTKKASTHKLKHGRFYKGRVTFVNPKGQVSVFLPDIKCSYDSVTPQGTTPTQKLKIGDVVDCTFTDEFFTDIVIFGSSNFKPDVFATKVAVESLLDEINSLKARVSALENQ
jgi:hypothetical protein